MANSSILASFINIGLGWRPMPVDAVTLAQAELQHMAFLARIPLAAGAVVEEEEAAPLGERLAFSNMTTESWLPMRLPYYRTYSREEAKRRDRKIRRKRDEDELLMLGVL